MTDTPAPDTPTGDPAPAALSRAQVFHQIRLDVYRLALPTIDPELYAAGRGFIIRPPLLTDLRDATRPNQGGTGAGGSAPNTRVGFDVGAFELLSDLTARIASAYESATDRPPTDTPELMVLEVFIELEAAGRIKGNLTDAQLHTQRDRIRTWRQRIEDHFTPPRMKEILLPCPDCGATHATNDQGDQGRALIATHSPGRLTIRCRACGSTWEDELGATVLNLRTKITTHPEGDTDDR